VTHGPVKCCVMLCCVVLCCVVLCCPVPLPPRAGGGTDTVYLLQPRLLPTSPYRTHFSGKNLAQNCRRLFISRTSVYTSFPVSFTLLFFLPFGLSSLLLYSLSLLFVFLSLLVSFLFYPFFFLLSLSTFSFHFSYLLFTFPFFRSLLSLLTFPLVSFLILAPSLLPLSTFFLPTIFTI
jgi:hypothetical protein